MFRRTQTCPMQLGCQRVIKDIIDQRRLTAAGNTCYNCKNTQWDLYIDVLQVVCLRALDFNKTAIIAAAFFRYGNKPASAQVLARY